MTKFSSFNAKIDTSQKEEVELKKLDLDSALAIKEYVYCPLDDSKSLKHTIEPNSITKFKQAFELNSLVHASLKIEEKEKKHLETIVQQQVEIVKDQIEKNAYDVGYQKGYKDGFQKSFQEATVQVNEAIQKFMVFVEACEKSSEKIFYANEKFLLLLINRIARQVLHKELVVDNLYLQRLSIHLIQKINLKDNITLKMSQQDAKTADFLSDTLPALIPSLKNFRIELSENLTPGTVMIHNDFCELSSHIDTALNAIEKELLNEDISSER
jgi:flagellar assembly protein FliH